jgi:dihydroorotase
MNHSILISGSTVINEGSAAIADVLIEDGYISKIAERLDCVADKVIDGRGKHLLPGIIDTHVHFREPGLTHKGDISSESAAAVAGGVTSYFEMPNTLPHATSLDALAHKESIARTNSFANYAFYLGTTEDTTGIPQLQQLQHICGITDDGLYFNKANSLLAEHPEQLKQLLQRTPGITAIHSEQEAMIEANAIDAIAAYGNDIPARLHPYIRSEAACYNATVVAIEAAKQVDGRLHILHLTTGIEAALFTAGADVRKKLLTSEVCVHHLWFSDADYEMLGNKIKCNPAIKKAADREALLQAVNDNRIDVISSDHAPHTEAEKNRPYTEAPSGIPLVQHSLLLMLALARQGKISISTIVTKMCHNPALLFGIQNRGFIRSGYHADLVLVDLQRPTVVDRPGILYKCGWSPFEGTTFPASIYCTIVNGQLCFSDGRICAPPAGQRLLFGDNHAVRV